MRREQWTIEGHDEAETEGDGGRAEGQHQQRVKDAFKVARAGQGRCQRQAKQQRQGNGCSGVGQRVAGRFGGRNVEDRAAAIDEEFAVIGRGQAVLHIAALTAIRFEAGEGTEWEGRQWKREVNSEQ